MNGWRFIIDGVRPYDGEYPFDPHAEMTTTEWGWIKKLSGYKPMTVQQGIADGDPELFVALAVVAMHKEGKIQKTQALGAAARIADAPFGSAIRFEYDGAEAEDAEDDADPPAIAAVTPLQTPNGGESSKPPSAPLEATQ